MMDLWRCDITGNPVGTDTYMIGAPCSCQGCRAGREIERLRELVVDAEIALLVWDDGRNSEYWLRHPERAGEKTAIADKEQR